MRCFWPDQRCSSLSKCASTMEASSVDSLMADGFLLVDRTAVPVALWNPSHFHSSRTRSCMTSSTRSHLSASFLASWGWCPRTRWYPACRPSAAKLNSRTGTSRWWTSFPPRQRKRRRQIGGRRRERQKHAAVVAPKGQIEVLVEKNRQPRHRARTQTWKVTITPMMSSSAWQPFS